MESFAPVLLVFGRGVALAAGGYALTRGSLERFRAAADYVTAHAYAVPPRIVFTGGWAEASEGAAEPPAGWREGDLMLAQARAAGLDAHADLRVESRSRSTLENLLHSVEDGLLSGADFDATRPLGLVSHRWHLPRIRYLAGRVLGLRGAALLDIPADGAEPARGERAVRFATRLWFTGVRDPAALLARERRLVSFLRRTEHLVRRD